MLISLHLPKTAGTSFLALLEAHFGEALLRDYDDRPINRGRLARRARALAGCVRHALPARRQRSVRCIHGHFLPLKYALLEARGSRRWVTWLRDPVERLASHYHYWMRSYDPAEAGRLHRRVVRERWSFERFCLGPELRNLYSEFLWGWPLHRFDFIGLTEHFEEDVRDFSDRFLGAMPASAAPINVNAERDAGGAVEPYVEDPALRRAIEAHHARDVTLYRQAQALRRARRGA